MRLLAALATILTIVVTDPALAQSDFVEDSSFLQTTIGGKPVRLEALAVKSSTATGRLPIALIAHGKWATRDHISEQHAQAYAGQARDLASRGWLAIVVMRRGFGRSDGPPPVRLSCTAESLAAWFDADADDLAAALNTIGQRPDADPTRVIVIGESAGGAAAIALSARNPKGLLAVINVSGGFASAQCRMEDFLVSAFRAYGAKSRVASLWIYAKNDSFFGPDLIDRMRGAFLEGGGDARLVMLEPEGKEGHAIFGSANGRSKWLFEMDSLLRALNLPTWTSIDVNTLLSKLGARESDRGFIERYLAAPLEKAIAREKGGDHMDNGFGAPTLEQARRDTLEYCQRTKPACEIIMENDHRLAPAL
jgi:dienelactone hydrolase